MTGLWIALGIVGTLIAFLVVMGRRFAKQLARGARMWESVATELGLSLQPITGKPGRMRGDLDGFRIEVDIAYHTSGMPSKQRAQSYTRVRVFHRAALDAAECELALEQAAPEIGDASGDAYAVRVEPDCVVWLRRRILFERPLLLNAIRSTLAVASAIDARRARRS